jgi:NAD(P)-dependent dehydrogenase (short-subunit alcohol dehydrogenase family)
MPAFSDKPLAGKTAFVAGGTRGMNLAIARRFAAAGARVAVMSRNVERVLAATKEIEAAGGGEALGFSGDVREWDKVQAALGSTKERFGPIDVVVAGQAGNFYSPALGMSANGFKAVVDIDLLGTFNVFRASFEHLRRPGASLFAITAPEAVRAMHYQAHVCAAKAGVNMLIKCLALEWGPLGVRVNGLSPGPIEGSFGMENVAAPTAEIHDKIARAMPLKRFGRMDEVADGALFLASDAASYVTGTILDVDGGAAISEPEANLDAAADPRLKPKPKG